MLTDSERLVLVHAHPELDTTPLPVDHGLHYAHVALMPVRLQRVASAEAVFERTIDVARLIYEVGVPWLVGVIDAEHDLEPGCERRLVRYRRLLIDGRRRAPEPIPRQPDCRRCQEVRIRIPALWPAAVSRVVYPSSCVCGARDVGHDRGDAALAARLDSLHEALLRALIAQAKGETTCAEGLRSTG